MMESWIKVNFGGENNSCDATLIFENWIVLVKNHSNDFEFHCPERCCGTKYFIKEIFFVEHSFLKQTTANLWSLQFDILLYFN